MFSRQKVVAVAKRDFFLFNSGNLFFGSKNECPQNASSVQSTKVALKFKCRRKDISITRETWWSSMCMLISKYANGGMGWILLSFLQACKYIVCHKEGIYKIKIPAESSLSCREVSEMYTTWYSYFKWDFGKVKYIWWWIENRLGIINFRSSNGFCVWDW